MNAGNGSREGMGPVRVRAGSVFATLPIAVLPERGTEGGTLFVRTKPCRPKLLMPGENPSRLQALPLVASEARGPVLTSMDHAAQLGEGRAALPTGSQLQLCSPNA